MTAEQTKYLWHPELHSKIASEQLIFALIGFDPVYRRGPAVNEIKTALRALHVNSYAIWELLGEHDLMLQAWLPRRTHVEELLEEINRTVSDNVEAMTMMVDKVLQHWMWNPVIDVGSASKAIERPDYVHLNSPDQDIPAARIADYRERGYIHETPETGDMKFFLRITPPSKSTALGVKRELTEMAKNVLLNGQVSQGVLMKVQGGGEYLLTGRVRPEEYPAITEIVDTNFGESGLLRQLRSRTVTHISALPAPADRREQLLPSSDDDPAQKPTTAEVMVLMARQESDDLEFKASAFTDLENLIGRRSGGRPKEDEARDVAKAIVGMLNADGGTVLVGIAEADKYTDEQLSPIYGPTERHGDHIAVGVNNEFSDTSGWDAYQRRLARRLRQLIEDDVDSWIKFHDVPVGQQTVCVIRVSRPSHWFYLNSKDKYGKITPIFYGRVGGETIPREGREADAFKEAHPRTTRGTAEYS